MGKKTAVITGAASGIGLAAARRLAADGFHAILIDLSAEAVAAEAAALVEQGLSATGLACDVAREDSVAAAFAHLATPLDALVNCAGIAHVGSLESTTVADMDRLFAVNVRGTFLCMKAAVSRMSRGGAIVNMASIAATRGLSDRFAYSMTKGAVLSMTLSVAKDYLAKSIRCNCVSPARVHTPFVDGFVAKNYPGREAEKLKELATSQPIGRMATPEEVAALIAFLCSGQATFLTGADVPMDGGFFNLR